MMTTTKPAAARIPTMSSTTAAEPPSSQRPRAAPPGREEQEGGSERWWRKARDPRTTLVVVDDDDDSGGDFTEHVELARTKLIAVWNNVKYGWTLKVPTSFKENIPIWLLGECYRPRLQGSQGSRRDTDALEKFRQDFTSRLWFTYRRQFPHIDGSSFTTDCGWGCMLRSGQMLLAQALVAHFLRRAWRLYSAQSRMEEAYHRQIIRWFSDSPTDDAPFSLHRLVAIGQSAGKRAGDWYGPASVAHILREAVERAPLVNPLLSQVAVYVAQDCTVYKQDVLDVMRSRTRHYSGPEDGPKESRAVVVLVPVRLGGDTLNKVYIPCVQQLLTHPACLGVIGGRPKHSLFFVGYQGEKLVHLDPHYCQDNVDTKPRNFPIHSFHCMTPRKMSFTRMDPSCTVGFYCPNESALHEFVSSVEAICSPPKSKLEEATGGGGESTPPRDADLTGSGGGRQRANSDLRTHGRESAGGGGSRPSKKVTSYPMFIVADGRAEDYNLTMRRSSSHDSFVHLSHGGGPRSSGSTSQEATAQVDDLRELELDDNAFDDAEEGGDGGQSRSRTLSAASRRARGGSVASRDKDFVLI